MSAMNIVDWMEATDVKSKIMAIHSMCDSYLRGDYNLEQKRAAEGAMLFLLDDPSPKVRQALSACICVSEDVPKIVLDKLVQDKIDVSAPILAYSKRLDDNSLINHVARGEMQHRMVIAQRSQLSPAVSASLIEIGESQVIIELLNNNGADIANVSLHRLIERFGKHGSIRSSLLGRENLPFAIRCRLVEDLCDVFAGDSFLQNIIGDQRAQFVAKDACSSAKLSLVESCVGRDVEPLADYFLETGQMTQDFLMSVLCVGNVDFFAVAIGRMTDKDSDRIRAILNDGRIALLKALYKKAGIAPDLAPMFVEATLLWRSFAKSNKSLHLDDIISTFLEKYSDDARTKPEVSELLMSIDSLRVKHNQSEIKSFANSLIAQRAA